MSDDVLDGRHLDTADSPVADGSAHAGEDGKSFSARESKSDASSAEADETDADDEASLSEKEETEASDVESKLGSDSDASEVDFTQPADSKDDDTDDLVLGECYDCTEPVFLKQCGSQCPA